MAWQKCHKVGGYTKPPASPKLIPSVAAPPPALGVRWNTAYSVQRSKALFARESSRGKKGEKGINRKRSCCDE